MIYITGDCHADFRRFSIKNFPEQREMTKDDYIIICGDFGAVWDGSDTDKYIQKWYNEKPWTTLFVDGNHENFDLLAQYPVSDWNGGKVQFITPTIIHLMRGQVYTIEGKTFFVMGGAFSVDQWNRTEHKSWWSQELPSDEEYKEGFENLCEYDNKVDFILTHCAPDKLQEIVGYYGYLHDKLTNYLQIVSETVEYNDWYLGHYHQDLDYGRFHVRYQKIDRII